MLAVACLSVCLLFCSGPNFLGVMELCPCLSAGETCEVEGYTSTVWAVYLVGNLLWPGQNLLDLGTCTRGNWLGLGYSELEKGDRAESSR